MHIHIKMSNLGFLGYHASNALLIALEPRATPPWVPKHDRRCWTCSHLPKNHAYALLSVAAAVYCLLQGLSADRQKIVPTGTIFVPIITKCSRWPLEGADDYTAQPVDHFRPLGRYSEVFENFWRGRAVKTETVVPRCGLFGQGGHRACIIRASQGRAEASFHFI